MPPLTVNRGSSLLVNINAQVNIAQIALDPIAIDISNIATEIMKRMFSTTTDLNQIEKTLTSGSFADIASLLGLSVQDLQQKLNALNSDMQNLRNKFPVLQIQNPNNSKGNRTIQQILAGNNNGSGKYDILNCPSGEHSIAYVTNISFSFWDFASSLSECQGWILDNSIPPGLGTLIANVGCYGYATANATTLTWGSMCISNSAWGGVPIGPNGTGTSTPQNYPNPIPQNYPNPIFPKNNSTPVLNPQTYPNYIPKNSLTPQISPNRIFPKNSPTPLFSSKNYST